LADYFGQNKKMNLFKKKLKLFLKAGQKCGFPKKIASKTKRMP